MCGTPPHPGPSRRASGRARGTGRTLAAVGARAGVSPSTASLAFAGARGSDPGHPRAGPRRRGRARVRRPRPDRGVAAPRPQRRRRCLHRRTPALRLPRPRRRADDGRDHRGAGRARRRAAPARGRAGRPGADQLARMPLDAAIFATCGLEDDPALDLLRARGVPRGRGGGARGRGRRADRHRRPGRDRRTRRAPARPRPPPGRVRRDAAAPGRHPRAGRRRRRARVHYRDVRHRIAAVEDVFGPVP